MALLAIPLLVAVGAFVAASDFGSPPLVTDLGVAFPKHGEPLNRRSEDVGGGGVLVLDDVGCLRLGGGGGPEADVSRTQTVPIWPRDFDLALEGGEVLIVDAEGEEVARVGDKVEMNGAPMEEVYPQREWSSVAWGTIFRVGNTVRVVWRQRVPVVARRRRCLRSRGRGERGAAEQPVPGPREPRQQSQGEARYSEAALEPAAAFEDTVEYDHGQRHQC